MATELDTHAISKANYGTSIAWLQLSILKVSLFVPSLVLGVRIFDSQNICSNFTFRGAFFVLVSSVIAMIINKPFGKLYTNLTFRCDLQFPTTDHKTMSTFVRLSTTLLHGLQILCFILLGSWILYDFLNAEHCTNDYTSADGGGCIWLEYDQQAQQVGVFSNDTWEDNWFRHTLLVVSCVVLILSLMTNVLERSSVLADKFATSMLARHDATKAVAAQQLRRNSENIMDYIEFWPPSTVGSSYTWAIVCGVITYVSFAVILSASSFDGLRYLVGHQKQCKGYNPVRHEELIEIFTWFAFCFYLAQLVFVINVLRLSAPAARIASYVETPASTTDTKHEIAFHGMLRLPLPFFCFTYPYRAEIDTYNNANFDDSMDSEIQLQSTQIAWKPITLLQAVAPLVADPWARKHLSYFVTTIFVTWVIILLPWFFSIIATAINHGENWHGENTDDKKFSDWTAAICILTIVHTTAMIALAMFGRQTHVLQQYMQKYRNES